MQEISLNILDVTQNSITAGASLIGIDVVTRGSELTVEIRDDGCGMTEEQAANVTDPFYTTRTTRRVGLGIPFFKMAAEMTGGSFSLRSQKGVGTTVTAVFDTSNIDCMPLGDIGETIFLLVTQNECDFVYHREIDGRSFTLDTRELREILGGIPLSQPEVAAFVKEYIAENSPDGREITEREIR